MTEVVAALIWNQGKFMICQRPTHKARGLLWEFVAARWSPEKPRNRRADPGGSGGAGRYTGCGGSIYGCGP